MPGYPGSSPDFAASAPQIHTDNFPTIEEDSESNKLRSFREFLRTYRTLIFIILLLAFTWRVVLAIGFPRSAGDEARYTVPAVNMLAGRGFSSDRVAPILPTEHTVPLYPLFIAGIYGVFGVHNSAVRIAQSAVDLATALLVAFVAYNLAPTSLRRSAAISALTIYAFLCWFTVSWTRYILTETLASFLTMLAVGVSILPFRDERWRWAAVGLICGLALMTRPDSLLLVFAFSVLLIFRIARRRSSTGAISLLLFASAISLVLTPWSVRNYVAIGNFQPLASPTGRPHGEYVPSGYLWWIRTWMTDQTHYHAYDPIINPDLPFDPQQLPAAAFDSVEEKARILFLFDQYAREGKFTPDLSREFGEIAGERIKRHPLRFFVSLPARRMAGMWLTGFATSNPLHRLLRILMVLPILIGGALGFIFARQNWPLVGLLLLIILIRTLFFGFLNSSEHYIVEAYPPVIAACGVTCALLWHFLGRLRIRDV